MAVSTTSKVVLTHFCSDLRLGTLRSVERSGRPPHSADQVLEGAPSHPRVF